MTLPDDPTAEAAHARRPTTPEAPDQPQPPGAGELEGKVTISLEPPAGVVVAGEETDGPQAPPAPPARGVRRRRR